MAHQLQLLPFHLAYLVGQCSGLPIVVINVGVQVRSSALALLLQLILLFLDPVFVKLQLSLLLTHLVGQLLEHGDLLSGLFIHELGLLGHLRVVAGF